jgi:hypothetical protein
VIRPQSQAVVFVRGFQLVVFGAGVAILATDAGLSNWRAWKRSNRKTRTPYFARPNFCQNQMSKRVSLRVQPWMAVSACAAVPVPRTRRNMTEVLIFQAPNEFGASGERGFRRLPSL